MWINAQDVEQATLGDGAARHRCAIHLSGAAGRGTAVTVAVAVAVAATAADDCRGCCPERNGAARR